MSVCWDAFIVNATQSHRPFFSVFKILSRCRLMIMGKREDREDFVLMDPTMSANSPVVSLQVPRARSPEAEVSHSLYPLHSSQQHASSLWYCNKGC